eukprot:gene5965-9964_t
MSFNYSQLNDETEQVYTQNYPQVNNVQPQNQQTQPLPYQPQQQNIYPQTQNGLTQQSSSTQNVQQNEQTQNVQPQFQQPMNPVNPITHQQTSWVTPTSVEPILVLLCNFFLPGLGHIVLGQYKKGIAFLITFMVIDFIIVIIASLTGGIGLILYPILFVPFCIYLIDGQILADRSKRGFPLMHGECGTSWAKPGLSLIMSDKVFCHANLDECPEEWVSRMQQMNNVNQQNVQHQS